MDLLIETIAILMASLFLVFMCLFIYYKIKHVLWVRKFKKNPKEVIERFEKTGELK